METANGDNGVRAPVYSVCIEYECKVSRNWFIVLICFLTDATGGLVSPLWSQRPFDAVH